MSKTNQKSRGIERKREINDEENNYDVDPKKKMKRHAKKKNINHLM